MPVSEAWYIAPVAAKFGEFGGDLGFELSLV